MPEFDFPWQWPSGGQKENNRYTNEGERCPRFDVTIAGELNLDLILYGVPEELPRERELLADRMKLTLGGSSAILAHNLAALGSRVGFQSRIGDDDLGRSRCCRCNRVAWMFRGYASVEGTVRTGITVICSANTGATW